MISLEVQRDISEGGWVPVDVESPDSSGYIFPFLLGLPYLGFKILGEIGRRCVDESRRSQSTTWGNVTYRQMRWMRQKA